MCGTPSETHAAHYLEDPVARKYIVEKLGHTYAKPENLKKNFPGIVCKEALDLL